MSGDLERLKETGAMLEKDAEGLNPLYQPLQDARFFIVDTEAKENDYFVSLSSFFYILVPGKQIP